METKAKAQKAPSPADMGLKRTGECSVPEKNGGRMRFHQEVGKSFWGSDIRVILDLGDKMEGDIRRFGGRLSQAEGTGSAKILTTKQGELLTDRADADENAGDR